MRTESVTRSCRDRVTEECRECGDDADVEYLYVDRQHQMMWWVAYYCGSCAAELEGVDWPQSAEGEQQP